MANVGLLAVTSKQVFAHYVTPTLPFVFVVFAAGARAAFADRRLKVALLALAAIVCVGGVEATLSISRRVDGRNGLAVHRAVARRVLDDCAAQGARPSRTVPPASTSDFLRCCTRTESSRAWRSRRRSAGRRTPNGFAYRLQKREDPPPPGAGAFPTTALGPVNLYRLK